MLTAMETDDVLELIKQVAEDVVDPRFRALAAEEVTEKMSKSRGNVVTPDDLLVEYSSDAVRYWAASTGLGKDAVISEHKIQLGAKLVTKLWNVARFCQRFLKVPFGLHLGGRLIWRRCAGRWMRRRRSRKREY